MSSLPDDLLIMPKRYSQTLVSNCAHVPYEIPAVFNTGILSVFTWEFLPLSCWIGTMIEPRSAKTEFSEVQLVGIIELSLILVNSDSLVTHNAISKMN